MSWNHFKYKTKLRMWSKNKKLNKIKSKSLIANYKLIQKTHPPTKKTQLQMEQ